jgi:asparagine synthase (glutamine-hydrolysing)
MCGIGGLFGARQADTESVLRAMGEAIRTRGPDDSGVFFQAEQGIGLVHRRLSIIDVSAAGHQPMHSACQRYVIVFNGEIYNHLILREQLERSGCAPNWRGGSDTETLLAAIVAWGLQKTLEAAVGMFALALWDSLTNQLSLARDRLGEKPLYYGWIGTGLGFASELKALAVVPGFRCDVDRSALSLFMRHNYVPAPRSIYAGIYKLAPGTVLTIGHQHLAAHLMPEPKNYWSAASVAKAGMADEYSFTSDEVATDALEGFLREAVRGQMVADVPIGAFLSGGIDSSTIVALMQAEAIAAGAPPVKTFTIGFGEGSFNEARHAEAVARHLGTEHTELYVSSRDVLAIIPELPNIYDEPFADSSQLPTCLVSHLARQQVKVALSGDGGDELFGGYDRYALTERFWNMLSRVPNPLRKTLARAICGVPVATWNSLYGIARPILPGSLRSGFPGDKIHKGAALLQISSVADLYQMLISHWEPSTVVIGDNFQPQPPNACWPDLPQLTEQMMLLDTCSYLPDDILVKVDRAAMNVGLETRLPLLDHRVVEFAWHLPGHLKRRSGATKWLLRQVLYRHVPRTLIDRPKMGFAVPLDSWLRGPLRDWAESLLDESRLRQDGYFDPAPIRQKWAEHLSGQRNWQYLLWDVLMFNAWLESR